MRITRVLLISGTVAVLANPALAAKKPSVPDWVQAVLERTTQDTVSLQGHYDAEYLLNEQIVRFDGETAAQQITTRRITRVLTANGLSYGHDLVFSFDGQSKIESIAAWTVKPDGRVIPLPPTQVHETALFGGQELYSDLKAKTFSMPEINVGDILAYEVKKNQIHPVWSPGFSGEWDVQKKVPTRLARFTLQLPPQWSYRYRLYQFPDRAPRVEAEGVHVWEWEMVPASLDEPLVPYRDGERRVSGYLVYNCVSGDPRWAERNRASWDDIAALYDQLSRARLTPDAEMKQVVADLVKECTSDLEKVRVIANYVRRTLTYVAVEIGVGGYQPHHVQAVFRNKYGDCKDMSSLVISLLRQAGITAYPVLIRTINDGNVDPDFPRATFNHAIVYVPLTEQAEPWIRDWPVQPPLGRGLWIDATSETSSIRELPWTVQGTYALVVAPEKGYLLQTPVFGPQFNVERRTGTARISSIGDLSYEGEETFSGNLDMGYKWALRQGTDQDRREWAQRHIGNQVARCTLQYFKHSPYEDLDTPLGLQYGFTASRFANIAGNLLFFRPNVLNAWPHNPFTAEKHDLPVFYEYPWSEVDSLTFHLPPAYQVDELPRPINLETHFGRFQASYLLQGETLLFTRSLSIAQREIPPEEYATLKTFFETVIRSDKAQVVLKSTLTAKQP